MRIIAGKYRGTNIPSPKEEIVKPTLDRIKENVFNIIQFNKCKKLIKYKKVEKLFSTFLSLISFNFINIFSSNNHSKLKLNKLR